ncbi:DUF3892 domain-containing protein [Xylanimonas protaetiae]|uniref:DUF3892 domain-containing protein n=1 Tax=Xylanimonas protaetiae TaxID=2509457 RepID=A0A4P6F6M9_9MICO|nr:DUF3892 domain-containing protein [Xylanimonas protaetiae]QAY71412.1 DUF3892 domain-containing protein [Xylanimonas protaetiae]
MSVRITHIRLSGNGNVDHEHITHYAWVSSEIGKAYASSKAAMVEWIDKEGGRAFVESAGTVVSVGVVKPHRGEPYLRTQANGVWTDSLLSLPRF